MTQKHNPEKIELTDAETEDIRARLIEAEQSGVSDRTPEEIREDVRAELRAEQQK